MLATCTRRVALVVVAIHSVERCYIGKRPRSFGARPWCDVPAAVFKHQASAACHSMQAHLRSLSLSLGRRRSTRACYARATWRAGCARNHFVEEPRSGKRHLSFGVRPW